MSWTIYAIAATAAIAILVMVHLYVDRRQRVVVVKTSAWPYDDPWQDRQCRDLCYLALPAIADAAAAAAGAGTPVSGS